MNTKNYDEMSVTELRIEVRERGLAKGGIVASAKKDDLISLLNGEIHTLPAGENTPATTQPRVSSDDLADVIAAALRGKLGNELDESRVIELIQLHSVGKTVNHIHIKGADPVELDEHTHVKLAKVLHLVGLGFNVLLVGPAGTGKTTLASQVAKAMNRRFSFNSMSSGCSESHLIGRTLPDSTGNWSYKPSPFVTTYQNGGVHLFDEIDAADSNLMVMINAALANGQLSLPFEDMVIDRHEHTVIIAAANTYGTGASRQYCGRNQLDEATLDRFAVAKVEVGYDESLERSLVGAYVSQDKRDSILARCWSVRSKIESASLRRVMSTRTVVGVAKRVAAGDQLNEVMEDYFLGWSKDEKARVA